MPRATVDPGYNERIELKSCPALNGEDAGFVVLRRMTYETYLERREIAANVEVEGGMGKKKNVDQKTLIHAMQRKVAHLEFAECIVEHNLEDANGNLLDFTRASTLKVLDPRIGEEIGSHIDRMNQFDEEEDDDSRPPSQTESTTP
jgi:hypothetical protein